MINAIIIDDEHDAIEVLSILLKTHCNDVKVVATANSVKEGKRVIQENDPDLVFLDVEMPVGSGFDVLKNLQERNFKIIFVTAHNHYAINAIKFSAVDYLLKPVDSDDLIAAVEKVRNYSSSRKKEQYDLLVENLLAGKPNKLAIPIKDGFQYIALSQIIRIEADGSYCTFYLEKGKKIMVSQNIGVYDELLNKFNFYRTHNSHLINIEHIHQFLRSDGGIVIMSDDSKIPVSRRNKEGLKKISSALQ